MSDTILSIFLKQKGDLSKDCCQSIKDNQHFFTHILINDTCDLLENGKFTSTSEIDQLLIKDRYCKKGFLLALIDRIAKRDEKYIFLINGTDIILKAGLKELASLQIDDQSIKLGAQIFEDISGIYNTITCSELARYNGGITLTDIMMADADRNWRSSPSGYLIPRRILIKMRPIIQSYYNQLEIDRLLAFPPFTNQILQISTPHIKIFFNGRNIGSCKPKLSHLYNRIVFYYTHYFFAKSWHCAFVYTHLIFKQMTQLPLYLPLLLLFLVKLQIKFFITFGDKRLWNIFIIEAIKIAQQTINVMSKYLKR